MFLKVIVFVKKDFIIAIFRHWYVVYFTVIFLFIRGLSSFLLKNSYFLGLRSKLKNSIIYGMTLYV